MMPSLTKEINKQLNELVASLKAESSQTIQRGIDESTHAANSLRIDIILIYR
jgi:hypothetical protein